MSLKRFWKPLGTSALVFATLRAAPAVDILTPSGGLPPNIVGQMREPSAFVQASDGSYVIFDPRAQQVYGVDAAKKTLKRLVAIGPSDGQILRPNGFAYNSNKTFTIVDVPGAYERVKTFYEDGTPLSRFQRWPARAGAVPVSVNGAIFGGISSMAGIGRNTLAGAQAIDANTTDLIDEIDADGNTVRRIGTARSTGQDTDATLRRALNAGIPLVAPDGSIYFVFTNGLPMYRKYSAAGDLVLERHIEGPELDRTIQSLPTVWPTRRVPGGEFPAVTVTVTAAAIDARGNLWISLDVPFTYVYGADGNKTRTVQFRGTELMTPTSFFFTKDERLLVTPGCYEFSTGR
jgi:hypothetical protein